MSSILRGVHEGFLYRKGRGYLFTLDPLAKVITLLVQIIGVFLGTTLIRLLLLLLSIVEGVLNGIGRRIFVGIKSIAFPILIAFGLVSLFQGFTQGFKVILLMLTFIIIMASFTETTSPTSVVRALEVVHLPIKISYGVALAIKLIPEIASDALDSILSFTLRGEFKSKRSLGDISKILAALFASAITKSKYIGEALAIKGFASKKRRSIYTPNVSWKETIRFLIYFALPFLQFFSFLDLSCFPLL